MRFVRLDKAFIGREALLARDPRSQIALLALDGEETDCLGGEAVLRDGTLVGTVTSAGYGYTVGQSLAIAFLGPEASAPGTALEVSLLGKLTAARVLPEAPFDPRNERLKSDIARRPVTRASSDPARKIAGIA